MSPALHSREAPSVALILGACAPNSERVVETLRGQTLRDFEVLISTPGEASADSGNTRTEEGLVVVRTGNSAAPAEITDRLLANTEAPLVIARDLETPPPATFLEHALWLARSKPGAPLPGGRYLRVAGEAITGADAPLARRSPVPNAPLRRPISVRRGEFVPDPKALLVVLPHFKIGGADKWALDLLRRLRRDHGMRITLVCTGSGPHTWLSHFEAVTADIHLLDAFLQPDDYPAFFEHLLGDRQPGVVLVSNSHFGYAIAPYLKTKFPKIAFVDYVHAEAPGWRSGGYAMDSVRHGAAFDRTIVSSHHLVRWMAARGADVSRVMRITINIDERHWSRESVEPGRVDRFRPAHPGIPQILYASRFESEKQPDVFASIAERLISKGVPAAFVVAGDGPMASVISSLVKRHPRHVRWLGPVQPADMRDLLAASDILLLPSRMEGISLAIYEAMAMGVVPVSVDVGGQSELVTPDCGVLIDRSEDEVNRYVEAVTGLLVDEQTLSRMKVACRERIVRHFTCDAMVDAMVGAFSRARRETLGEPRLLMSPGMAEAYACEIVEQFRLAGLCEGLWGDADTRFKERFRRSRISPKFSKLKRGILRFIMNRL